MKLIYVAGAYTAKHAYEVKQNIMRADVAGMQICALDLDAFPVIPHTNTAHYEGIRDGDYFIQGTKELMRRCDAILVVSGYEDSVGTKGEIEEATKLGKLIFYDVAPLKRWLLGHVATQTERSTSCVEH